ncbi:16S rRNA pseudouridine(516) synthase [Cohnella sp. CIP 111063]|uniref:pseudouridine synthase n=1 Tax=unclassified Cohnella TaxID=2636738 RepID=UPI000B8C3793|nr:MULTISPECIES: pseudouridine synthase [unclassified Cohnella]OXS58037.1 16S rRNA pseudouridine(516) synthase [Cohnella sp. CIP 111063]PRX71373.1 16S rRNA pseudouridine516 synthase [Cohnella sp. SGD-V74]
MKATIRLDKMLGNLGYGTRSVIKQWIKQGAVTVNGETVKDHGKQIRPNDDTVTLNGETIRYRDTVYVLLHKPAGVVSATEDYRDRTVIDLLDEDITVLSPFPVGRLDKDTEGLLLITNDGKLSHELLSPKKHVPKTYRALVAGAVGEPDAEAFAKGVELDDGYVTMPAQLRALASVDAAAGGTMQADEPDDAAEMSAVLDFAPSGPEAPSLSWIELTIHEGKFHQVKRMFEAVGKKVLYLRRVSMGPLKLDPALAPGEWRELTEDEVDNLRNYRKDGQE